MSTEEALSTSLKYELGPARGSLCGARISGDAAIACRAQSAARPRASRSIAAPSPVRIPGPAFGPADLDCRSIVEYTPWLHTHQGDDLPSWGYVRSLPAICAERDRRP